MGILVAVLFCFLQSCFSQKQHGLEDESFDFKPFRDVVAKVVNKPYNPSQRSILPNSTSLDCVYPPKTVIFTYSTHYTRELILLQHQALDTSGLRSCLEEIWVTLCLDKKCVQYCEENNIQNVALVEIGPKSSNSGTMTELPPSDFNKGEYRFLTYLKQELFYEALQVADHFFFLDVDCLLFKNPFVEIQYGRDELGHRIVFDESMSAGDHLLENMGNSRKLDVSDGRKGPAFFAVKKNDPETHPDNVRVNHPIGPGVSDRKRSAMATNHHAQLQVGGHHHGQNGDHRKNLKAYHYPDKYGYDLMYQRDRGRTLDCTGSVNTGQVYMRNSTRAQIYFQRFRELKGVIMEGKNGPEQDHVFDASQLGKMRICSLTPHLFTAHCYIDFGNIRYINSGRTPIKDIISYHVSCVEGLAVKKRRLMDVYNAVKAKNSDPMSNYL